MDERKRAVDILIAMAVDYEAVAEKPKKGNASDDVAFLAGEVATALRLAAQRIGDSVVPAGVAHEHMRAFAEKRPTKHDLTKHVAR